MKSISFTGIIFLLCCLFSACSNYHHVYDKNQYVHLYLLQNDTPYELIILEQSNDGAIGHGCTTGYSLLADVIINYKKEITENTLFSLSQDTDHSSDYIELQLVEKKEDGTIGYSDSFSISADMENGPFWSSNYTQVNTDSVKYYDIDSYKKKVADGHVKAYVISITEEYLASLK